MPWGCRFVTLVLGGCFDFSFCAECAHLQHGGLDIDKNELIS